MKCRIIWNLWYTVQSWITPPNSVLMQEKNKKFKQVLQVRKTQQLNSVLRHNRWMLFTVMQPTRDSIPQGSVEDWVNCVNTGLCVCVTLSGDQKKKVVPSKASPLSFHTHAYGKPHKQTHRAQTGYYHSTASALQHQRRLVLRWPSITQHTAQICREPSIFSLHLSSPLILPSPPLPQSSLSIRAPLSWGFCCFFALCLYPGLFLQSSHSGFIIFIIPLRDHLSPRAIVVPCLSTRQPPKPSKNLKRFPTLSSMSPPSLILPPFHPFLLSITYSVVAVKSTPGRLICWWQIAVN